MDNIYMAVLPVLVASLLLVGLHDQLSNRYGKVASFPKWNVVRVTLESSESLEYTFAPASSKRLAVRRLSKIERSLIGKPVVVLLTHGPRAQNFEVLPFLRVWVDFDKNGFIGMNKALYVEMSRVLLKDRTFFWRGNILFAKDFASMVSAH